MEAQATVTLNPVAQTIANNLKATIRKSPTGAGFVSIKNYHSSKSGEVANHLVNVGVCYDKAGQKDLKTLEDADLTTLTTDEFDVILLEKARQGLIKSIVDADKTKSNAQKDAYITICDGMSVKNDDSGDIYIWAHSVNKKVIIEGVYPIVKSRPLTLAKKYLTKKLDLRRAKFRRFKVSNIDQLKLNSQTI